MGSVYQSELAEIHNWAVVSDRLVTGGQPTETQVQVLARHGFQVIINLGLLDPRYCLPDERGLAKRLNMQYYQIPVDFESPNEEDLTRFFELLLTHLGDKVFVHCAANYRVSSFVSLYALKYLNWRLDEATDFLSSVWQPNPVWRRFIEDSCRRLNVAVPVKFAGTDK